MCARAQPTLRRCDDVCVSEQEPAVTPTPDVVASCVAWLIECLALDPQLAESFERTPGKVAHLIGIPYAVMPGVLEAYWKQSRGGPLP